MVGSARLSRAISSVQPRCGRSDTLATLGKQQPKLDRRAARVENQHQAARTATGIP
jgi:hypothetical protein